MKVIIFTVVAVAICPATVISQEHAEYRCVTSKDNAVNVLITNRRNTTGHLISQVEFSHREAQLKDPVETSETGLWTVHVEQKRDSCEGVEYASKLIFTITAPFRQPPSDYELFPGIGYYKFHNKVVLWPRAREICAEEGAHLIIINSEKEADVVKALFARYPRLTGSSENDWLWVGVTELESAHGQYVTIFGVPLDKTGFSRWVPGQPGDPSAGDYILGHRNGGLGDVPRASGYKQPFICEQEF